jgi:hypothetical protein
MHGPDRPASHHKKLAIVDGRLALAGGANIVETRRCLRRFWQVVSWSRAVVI